jgi:hypothetical protein
MGFLDAYVNAPIGSRRIVFPMMTSGFVRTSVNPLRQSLSVPLGVKTLCHWFVSMFPEVKTPDFWKRQHSHHSLTAPDVTPVTTNFWHNKKTMVMGSPPNTASAENVPQSFSCS